MELKDLGLQRINLDLSNNITGNFFAKEGDIGTRGLSIKVLNNSVETDTTGVSITMYARVGQEVCSVDAIVKDALKGEYELIYPTSILKSGIVYAELQLKKLTDIISTKKFKILVESGIVTDSAIEGHDSYPIFEQLLEAGANEITRESNEEIRKLNEIARVDAENLRGVRITEVENDLASHKENYTTQRQQDNLKVATVEKELNDYKGTIASINPNQEAKQNVSGYGIVSLPKNTVNGQVSVSVKGNTYTNLIKNGNFANGTTGWTASGHSLSVHNNIMRVTSGALQYPQLRQAIGVTPVIGSKIFIKLYVRVTNADCKSLSLFINGSTSGSLTVTEISNPAINQWYELKGIANIDAIIVGTLQLRVTHAYADGVSGRTMEVREVMATELIGEELNLTLEQLNAKYSNWLDSTKSTISASRLKSVGKNLLPANPSEWEEGQVTASGVLSEDPHRIRTKNLRKIPQETNFATSTTHGYAIRMIVWYDASKNFIERGTAGDNIVQTRPSNAIYYRVIIRKTNETVILPSEIEQIKPQLEKGTVVTPYEPYKENTQYLSNVGELRSLPNGVSDEIKVSGGKAELVKRVSDNFSTKPTDWSFHSIQDGICRFQITNIRDKYPNISNSFREILQNSGLVYRTDAIYSEHYYYDTLLGNGYLILYINSTKFTANTPLALVEYLNSIGTTLTYRLSEPIITPIEVSGTLLSNPSGTIYVENVVADAGIYTTKFNIKELPIKSIDKLIKYNFETGVQTVLDTSSAVINEDKKSFTHPNLTDKDMVFVDYYYDVESTLGETTIEYLDSRHTIKDSVNNKFYKWDIKSTNGVPTVILTEVL